MKQNKALSPYPEKLFKFDTDSINNSSRELEPTLRLGRENLKQFLSSDLIKIPKNSSKKNSLLVDHEQIISNSRPGPSFSTPSILKLPATNKFFGNIMAIKKANKNILNAFFSPKIQINQQGQSPVRLSIVDDFKAFQSEPHNDQPNFLNLTEWFDKNIRTTALFKYIEKDFFEKEKDIRDFLLINTEKFLNGALDRLLELVKSRSHETFLLINKIFMNYQKYWGIVSVAQNINLENNLQSLTKELEKQKSDFSNLAKKAKQKILTLKQRLKDKIQELAIKDSELDRLTRTSENESSEKTSVKNYEKIVKTLKNKVAEMLQTLQQGNSKSNVNKSSLIKSILSEFNTLENFKSHIFLGKSQNSGETENSESRRTSCQSVQTTVETSEKETMLNFVYFNAETQTYYIYNNDSQAQENAEEIEEEIKSLQIAGYIPAGAEIASWSAGYYTGLAHGKTIAQHEALQAEEMQDNQILDASFDLSEDESPQIISPRDENLKKAIKNFEESKNEEINPDFLESDNEEKEEQPVRDSEKKETLIRRVDNKKKTTITKFKEFNFQRREKIIIQKKVKSKKALNFIMKKSIHDLEKRKKMSKKMLVKIINTFYFSLIKSEEMPDNLLEYVYSDYETKNSMKKVVQRKVIDFLANLIQNASILKLKTFIRFLKLEKRIKEPGFYFPKDCLSMYLSGFDSILKSKLGFMPDFNDFSEINLVPVVRVSEFYKEKLSEILSPARMSKLFEFTEKNSTFDKKRLNKSGVIEIESALDFALTVYEDHLLKIKATGELIIKALTCDNSPEAIRKVDMVFIAGLLKPGKVIKELEAFNGEFIMCEEIFNGNIKEIFPEEFLDGTTVGYDKVMQELENSVFFNEYGYTDLFKECGKGLDTNILNCVYKIVEIYNKINN